MSLRFWQIFWAYIIQLSFPHFAKVFFVSKKKKTFFSPLFQAGGQHLGTEFSSQGGSSMQVDRGSPWISGPPENSSVTQHSGLAGPPPLIPGQMGPGNQPPRPQSVQSLQLFKISYQLYL